MKARDVYLVSVARDVRVQNGPTGRGPASAWRKLSRKEVREVIAKWLDVGCLSGRIEVTSETREDTAWLRGLSIHGVRVAASGRRARGGR